MAGRSDLMPAALVRRIRRATVILLLPWMTPFDLSVDGRFDLLDNPRRRFIIRTLAGRFPAGVPRGELVDELVTVEGADLDADEQSDLRNAIFVSLYQIHIPKLAEADVVAVDDEEVIALTTVGLHLVPYTTDPTAAERNASRMAAIAVAGGLVLAAWFAGLPIVGGLSAPWVVAGIVVALFTSSLLACRETLRQYRIPDPCPD